MSSSTETIAPSQILKFWFSEETRPLWFRSTDAFDEQIRRRFESAFHDALDGRLAHFRESAEGALALVILLDQFPLNMYRGEAEGFLGEAPAREVAEEAIRRGFDRSMKDDEKSFLYLPFMHSEDLADQDRSVSLFEQAGLSNNLRWARHHRDIVRQFGRFPHRNAVLGRESSAAELAWLESPEAFKG